MQKRLLFYLIGIAIACLGVTFLLKANVGAGPWDIVNIALVEKIGFTFGTWVIFFQVVFLFVNAFMLKKRPEYESVFTLVVWGLMMDFWTEIVFKDLVLTALPATMKWGAFLMGILLIGIGVGIYLTSNLPRMPYDGTMLAISDRFKVDINISRTILEGTALVMAFVLGGKIGIGTILIVLLIGNVIQFFKKVSIFIYHHKFSFKY
jgi:uncharacterized protein